jgi:pyruvate-ferredoxin/flavodoxin oxidoreductase
MATPNTKDKNIKTKIMDGNEAAASVAYRVTEVSAIYPITPSTPMGELADQWAAEGRKNIWGVVPQVIELQSEGGASGTLHGSLQAGALATTYTASQGLLLMIPNMYKIAGELTPMVMHVASRSLAAQALSIFGDHSDVMSVRSTGFAFLCSGSVQEAHDLALIAHAATLEARVPFLHFFEGFRVSHELNKVTVLSDDSLRAMISEELVVAHRKRALSPDHPCIRGTAQNPDVYFQGRETSNLYYLNILAIVEQQMAKFDKLTGRQYQLMKYYGAADAEHVVILMGSGAKAAEEAVARLQKGGEKVGVLQVMLYRPFSAKHFLAALPKSVRTLAVLDRTKEPGSLGEPLYQDVITVLAEAQAAGSLPFAKGMPVVISGRYGLSSKEFTPAMVKAVFDELKIAKPKNHFTVGIKDDVTNSSLVYDPKFITESEKAVRAIFYGLGSDGTVGANKNTIKIIGEETDNYAQGYFVYDSKKAGSKTVSHLRFGADPILSPYLIQTASFVGCHQFNFLETGNVLAQAAVGATFLLNSPYPADKVWEYLPRVIQQEIIDKQIKFYVIDGSTVARKAGMGSRTNTIMQTCFFAISGVLPRDEAIAKIKEAIVKTYKRKGDEVVQKNFAAVEQSLSNLHEVSVPKAVSANAKEFPAVVSTKAPEFVQKVIAPIMAGFGDDLPVSAIPADGTYPCGTTKWEKRNISQFVPHWNGDMCIQCGQCSVICPHGVIRAKHCAASALAGAPESFKTAKLRAKGTTPDEQFRLQVYVEDCTGCGLCNVVCPATDKANPSIKAIMLSAKAPILESERRNIEFFEKLPYGTTLDTDTSVLRGMQYLQPCFEFSGACAGCGETPYVKLISQLFGDRMLVANATGCSSIYGGNLPTTPWTVNNEGRGPAWANSLFEDNAEFGLGFRIACDQVQKYAVELLVQCSEIIGADLVNAIKGAIATNDEKEIVAQRGRVAEAKRKLEDAGRKDKGNDKIAHLLAIADYLVPRSVWLLGGDGWAYDIDYGGLDHVLACGKKVNILVLDTEVYSNTGGQSSKATPRGAIAKFAVGGKETARKDLGMIAMTYGNVYVAQISLGANPNQALKAIREAESYEGTSIIIAYSHCVAHGYEMKKGVEQQKLAVTSGFWPLYRYNPKLKAQGQNPLQIDSQEGNLPIEQYAYNEPRFKALLTSNPQHAAELLKQLQEDVKTRWQMLKKLAA